ncbi:MAG: cobyrinate a,c-diamide synthase [Lentisphaeria bacterium]|nr:cobyrinate a,c-diamide synthase [Lentisphaeria bacterium]
MSGTDFSQFMIAGTGSGSGKTTLTLGLLRALRRRGLRPAPFKCGPDYIDPLFHRQAAGRVSRNLDTFFGSENVYAPHVREADVAVVEGVMGLFDGIFPGKLQGSCAEIARNLHLPVLLTVNARGISGSVAPLVKGFAEWEKDVRIAGVIADNVGSPRHAELLRDSLEAAGLPPLIGFLERNERWQLPERHLGLSLHELSDAFLDSLAESLEKTLDFELLLSLTRAPRPESAPAPLPVPRLRLGVAMDEAFCFYYEANFDALRRAGVEIVPFSPLRDRELPPRLNGIYLGGGYPELFPEELGGNRVLRDALREFARSHLVYGECGGYLYLLEELASPDGRTFPGLGLLPGKAVMNTRIAALGYRSVEGNWGRLKGHEFHYASLAAEPPAPHLWQATDARGRRFACGGSRGRVRGSFIHLYFDSDPAFAEKFCRELEM